MPYIIFSLVLFAAKPNALQNDLNMFRGEVALVNDINISKYHNVTMQFQCNHHHPLLSQALQAYLVLNNPNLLSLFVNGIFALFHVTVQYPVIITYYFGLNTWHTSYFITLNSSFAAIQ